MAKLCFLLPLLLSVSLFAQTPNFNFNKRPDNGKPPGWNQIGNVNGYSFTLDSAVRHGGQYALKIAYVSGTGFGGSYWRTPVTFSGAKMTLTGFIKTQDVGAELNTYAGLWMRADDASGASVAFDNMQNHNAGAKGTTDWKQYSVTFALLDEAASIHIGGLLVGKGKAWFDDFTLTVDGKPIAKASPKVVANAQADTTFEKGSGIDLTTLTKVQITDLDLLGKVWGFIKYYHPAVAEGNHNMDAELFRVMPALLKATTATQRDDALRTWLNTFGPVDARSTRKSDTTKAVHTPDLAWFSAVSAPLKEQLEAIRWAKRSGKSYYIGMAPQVGNPVFKHELSYSQMKTPDAGYRLLSLYRFWTIIQYFFPYKHLIGEDWNRVLPEFIPMFVNARDSLSYRLAALSLIGRIHDTHANVWGDRIISNQYKGEYYAPVQTKFVGGQALITNFYSDSLGALSGLQRGDVINAIDGTPVERLVQDRKPYYPASNEPTQLRDIGRDLLRGQSDMVQLDIDRDGRASKISLKRYKRKDIRDYKMAYDGSSYPKDSCYQLIRPDVGYLFLGNIKADKLPQIMGLFSQTKGTVIDLRTYPSEFVVFSLGKYLTTPTPFAKFTTGSVQTPGLFTWTNLLKVGQSGVSDAYKGKVILLVNEQTQSQAEYTTMAFRQAPGAVVLGSTTAAADGNVSSFPLPGGLQTMISGIGVNYPDGRETQRVGVGVDIEMHPTRRGIQEGRDELLEKAISLIEAGK